MLGVKSEVRQGLPKQSPRYVQPGDPPQNQWHPPEQYGPPPPEQYGYPPQQQSNQPQQHGQQFGPPPEQYGPPPGPPPPPEQFGYPPQQPYNVPPQFGQPHGPPQLPWPQPPPNSTPMYGPPPQNWEQPPHGPPFNGPYPGDPVAAQPWQGYPPTPLPPLPPQQSGQPRPCVIPQITRRKFNGENMSPFVRVRVPELEHRISHHEFIVFIDELNEAFLANPALRTANNVANIGGMTPSVILQTASAGVNVVVRVGSTVTTKTRTKKYLENANKELFHPRGFHVQMCKTDKMLEYVGLGGQKNVFARQHYKHAFESAQQAPVHGPMGPSESNHHPIMQRMSSLGDRVMPLSFENVEQATAPEGFWKKWGAKEASRAEHRQNQKMMKDQAKQDRKARKKAGKGRDGKQHKHDDKNAKVTNRILWVVIAAYEGSAGGDEEWDSESRSSASHKH